MKSNVLLTRAIGGEFLSRKLAGFWLIFLIVAALALALIIWLVTVSAWWWLLAAPVIGLTIIGSTLLLFTSLLIKLIRPQLSKTQVAGTKEFVDKLERVADTVQTPVFIIVFRVIKDVILTPEETYVSRITTDSTTMHSDFAKLRKLFI